METNKKSKFAASKVFYNSEMLNFSGSWCFFFFCREELTDLFPHLSYTRLWILSVAMLMWIIYWMLSSHGEKHSPICSMFQKIFKDIERRYNRTRLVGSRPGSVGSVELLKLKKYPIRWKLLSLLADTRNHTDRKMWVMIQPRVNCEAIVTKWVRPSLR